MNILLIIIAILYLLVIGSLIFGMSRVFTYNPKKHTPVLKFSILIPFRNEEANLLQLLNSIYEIEYPSELFEVLLINDESSDSSEDIIIKTVRELGLNNISILNNVRTTAAPKKDAISTGVLHSKFEWILTSDADCQLPSKWLINFNAIIQEKKPDMVVGPVIYRTRGSILDGFQLMDILSLQGATIGGFGIGYPFLCNGANLAYSKHLFNTLNGFEGNSNIASGDDIFLMEKAIRHKEFALCYLKNPDHIVITKPQATLYDLVQQRKRWAAKTSSYSNTSGKIIGLTIFIMNLFVLIYPFTLIIDQFNWMLYSGVLAIKFSIDFILIYNTASQFKRKKHLGHYLFGCIFYPPFVVFIAISSLFSGYKWKQRHFNK